MVESRFYFQMRTYSSLILRFQSLLAQLLSPYREGGVAGWRGWCIYDLILWFYDLSLILYWIEYDLDVCCLMYLIYRIYVHDFGLINVWNPWVRRTTWCFVPHIWTRIAIQPSPPFGSQFQPFCLNSYTAPEGCSALPKNRRIETLKKWIETYLKPGRDFDPFLVEMYGETTTGECTTEKLNRTSWASWAKNPAIKTLKNII